MLALSEAQFKGGTEGMNHLVARIAVELRGLSDALTQEYFTHATAQVS